jgi:hypothetical protein
MYGTWKRKQRKKKSAIFKSRKTNQKATEVMVKKEQ